MLWRGLWVRPVWIQEGNGHAQGSWDNTCLLGVPHWQDDPRWDALSCPILIVSVAWPTITILIEFCVVSWICLGDWTCSVLTLGCHTTPNQGVVCSQVACMVTWLAFGNMAGFWVKEVGRWISNDVVKLVKDWWSSNSTSQHNPKDPCPWLSWCNNHWQLHGFSFLLYGTTWLPLQEQAKAKVPKLLQLSSFSPCHAFSPVFNCLVYLPPKRGR